ncbi:MAG: cytochrome C, partial [Anaerolineae bacterium]|nr:cytochrome C [Anaerolineae bacterium]
GRLKDVAGVYLPGRDHVAWIDRAGFGLAGLTLLGVIGHGTLRVARRGKRKEKGK